MPIVIWINVFAYLCLATFCLLLVKIRFFTGDLTAAARFRRHLLPHQSSTLLRLLGLEKLLAQMNELIEGYNDYARAHVERLNQLESTLGSIQEAVIIFSENKKIEYANESARQLFRQGGQLIGLRLESVLRAPKLIEYLTEYLSDRSRRQQQLSLEREGSLLWFEVSCAEARGVSENDGISTLLVLHDITQLKHLEEIRRDFVANVSHELRTPITIIKGYIETLIEDNEMLTNENRVRFLEKVNKNTQRLYLLVEDLMILSRLESKPDQINPSMASLRKLLDEIIENYSARLNPQKQKITLEFDDQIGEFIFDHFRIQQVYDNLIENIFSYAPDFTEIRLEAHYDDAANQVQCTVADNGPGIPEKDLPHIFERFYRVDKGRSYQGGGTGLGLSIMKHIVQQHGGVVSAESKPGSGTSIHFRLPYAKESGDEH